LVEFHYHCRRCNNNWYATKQDLRENKRLKKSMKLARFMRFGIHTLSYYRRVDEQIAQMSVAYRDYDRCPSCGSRRTDKIKERH
jgi:DNA-directed RNA polymerase subunit RPC12/RpoP